MEQPLQEQNYRNLESSAIAATYFERGHLQIFATSVLFPKEYRERVIESYEVGRRTLEQEILIEARIPISALKGAKEATLESIYFPVLMPRKGKLQDNLEILSSTGEILPTLHYREYLVLAARTSRMLVAHALRRISYFDVPPEGQKVASQAIKSIMSRVDRDGNLLGNDVPSAWADEVQVYPGDQAALAAKAALVNFVNLLTRHYVIVAQVKPDAEGRVILRVRQTLIPDVHLVSLSSRLGILLGARPAQVTFGLRNATTADSFHLRVNGPDDLYVGQQELENWKRLTVYDENDPRAIPPHYHFRPRLGQSHAHFYARHLTEANVKASDKPNAHLLTLKIGLFERPPGSTLPAAASALATFVLVWVTAVMVTKTGVSTSVAPGWFLAFPALVASWLGVQAPANRLPEGTLSARVSLLITILICISATGYYLVRQSLAASNDLSNWLLPAKWSILFISDYAYLLLLALASINAGAIIYKYLTRAAYFEYLSSRDQGSDYRQKL